MRQQKIRFTQSARKHKIGKAHVLYVLDNYLPQRMVWDGFSEGRFLWEGKDDRGLELEIIAVVTGNCLLVIHVMPRAFRGGNNGL